MSREAMQMALHTLEGWANYGKWVWPESALEQAKRNTTDSIAALRQALETEQEPVAWISDSPTKGNGKQLHWTKSEAWRWSSNITPLYTAPPKREWVGLTDEEMDELVNRFARYGLAREIESKLKEKNGG